MIEKLYRKGTEDEPEILLDAEINHFEISGRSIPENANTVFVPVFEWFDNYFKKANNETILILKLEYINSSSSKKLIELLMILEKQFENGNNIKIHWFYENMDISMQKKGCEFLSIFKIPYEIIPIDSIN